MPEQNTPSPEQIAEERYPYRSDEWAHLEMMEQKRDAYASCYREHVLKLEEDRTKLAGYAKHKDDCDAVTGTTNVTPGKRAFTPNGPCSCGLDSLLNDIRNLKP